VKAIQLADGNIGDDGLKHLRSAKWENIEEIKLSKTCSKQIGIISRLPVSNT
jgi:hypothetical protein